jgi:hypothetical protein
MHMRIVRANFVVAVWVCIIENAYAFGVAMTRYEQIRAHYAPFTARVVMAPLLIAFVELLLWFRFYRWNDRSARWAAAWAGAGFFLIVLIQLLRASIQIPISLPLIAFYTYFAISHLLYAAVGFSQDN